MNALPENDFVGVELDPNAPKPEPVDVPKADAVVDDPNVEGEPDLAAKPPKAETGAAAGGEGLAPNELDPKLDAPKAGFVAVDEGVLDPNAAGLEEEKPAKALGAAVEGVDVAEEPKAALVPNVGFEPNAGAPKAEVVEDPNVELPNPELPNPDPPMEGIEVVPKADLVDEEVGAEVAANGLGKDVG